MRRSGRIVVRLFRRRRRRILRRDARHGGRRRLMLLRRLGHRRRRNIFGGHSGPRRRLGRGRRGRAGWGRRRLDGGRRGLRRRCGGRARGHRIHARELGLALLALRHLAPGDHPQEKYRRRQPQQAYQNEKSATWSDFKTHPSTHIRGLGLLHIRSGALTPSRSSPFLIPSISTRARNSRARLSSRCSLIIRFEGLL